MSKEEGVLNDTSGVQQEKEPQMPTQAQIKAMQKQQAAEFAAYKKNLRENVEVKELQVKELELSLRYLKARIDWLDAQPEIEKLEAREAQQKAQDQAKAEARKRAENHEATAQPEPNKIVPVKLGKPREK